MFTSLLKHSLKALRRQKSYVLINIAGLAIGIACSLVISLFIIHELSFDRYHENKDYIYQIVIHGRFGGEEFKGAFTAPPIGPAMAREFPEVIDFLRTHAYEETVIRYKDNFFVENHFIEADSSFFHFFSIPLIKGNIDHILTEPFTVVISESTAKKIFGSDDPIDEMIRVGNHPQEHRIVGIMQDIPANTHFEANLIGSFVTNPRSSDLNWLGNSFSTYLMLAPGTDPNDIDEGLSQMINKYVGPQVQQFLGITIEDFEQQGNQYNLFVIPLTSIHLSPGIEQMHKPANDPRYMAIFGGIGLLILIIAAINFMNLSTAQATKRAREVAIKKVSGSSQSLLVGQFLAETIILSMAAMLIAIVITELSLPQINQLLDTQLQFTYLNKWLTLPIYLLISVFIGILAGVYPAFYLSSFNPIRVLKGRQNKSGELLNLRRALTTLQFAISIMLIVGTLVMHRQINYMLNKDLGFDKEQVLVVRRASVLGNQVDVFKNELLNIAGVISASASTAVPGRANNSNAYTLQSRPEESYIMQTNWVDHDFFETYGLKLELGRFFDPELQTDQLTGVINQKAVRNFSLSNPLEEKFVDGTQNNNISPVIGVLRDFHFESLRLEIRPSIFRFKNEDIMSGYVSVRITPSSAKTIISQIEEIWRTFNTHDPLLYFFIDKDFERLYKEEQQNAALSFIFTILAIIIASLGLYGLTSFTISLRIKEIGVRKTLGASTFDIWYLPASMHWFCL
jgi:putative ABC transport system permease protein